MRRHRTRCRSLFRGHSGSGLSTKGQDKFHKRLNNEVRKAIKNKAKPSVFFEAALGVVEAEIWGGTPGTSWLKSNKEKIPMASGNKLSKWAKAQGDAKDDMVDMLEDASK